MPNKQRAMRNSCSHWSMMLITLVGFAIDSHRRHLYFSVTATVCIAPPPP